MKFLASILILFALLLTGCKSTTQTTAMIMPPLPPVAKSSQLIESDSSSDLMFSNAVVIAPPVTNYIHLGWDPCNYTSSNEVTVIISSTDLTVPRSKWTIRFMGATDNCWITSTVPCEFYSAYNTFTNL
jgi:hypothetical protein